MSNALNWFEIPMTNVERAVGFYSTILDTQLEAGEMSPGFIMAMLPSEQGDVGGAIVQGEGYVPGAEGTLVYLNGGEDLAVILDRVEQAGGKILVPKSDIGENGFFALFTDTEGNKVGLHSMS